jgi:hypothetical protein
MMNGITWMFLALAWLWLSTGPIQSAPAQPTGTSKPSTRDAGEYEIKATYLRNFVMFINWPGTALGETNEPIIIGAFNAEPFGQSFAALQGGTVRRRPIKIRICQTEEDAQGCHVVFVNPRDDKRTGTILSALRGKPVVTVGETPEFLNKGGIIRFLNDDSHVRLEVNLAAARQAGLSFSSQLLGIAKVVDYDQAP